MADNVIKTRVELDITKAQQDLIKLNSTASDSTKDLTDRLEAKNKAVEIQNELSKKSISDLEEELKLAEATGASQQQQEALLKKLNAERVKATQIQENNLKTQNALIASVDKRNKSEATAADKAAKLAAQQAILEKKAERRMQIDNETTKTQQEIIKLNATAADTELKLEDRLVARQQATKLQNELLQKAITELEEELSLLEATGASTQEQEKVLKKLNAERLKASAATEANAKSESELAGALAKSKGGFAGLDDALGGVGAKFKALLANPVVLIIGAIVAAFAALKEAVGRSAKATAIFNEIGAKLSAVFNGIMAVLGPVVEWIGEKLLAAIENPKQAFIDFGNAIKENIINRFEGMLKLGSAIGEFFKGNFEKAGKMALDGLTQTATGIVNLTDKIKDFAAKAVEEYNKAADATEKLANKEAQLMKMRIAAQKQQLLSLKAAEKERQIRDNTSKSIEERIAANERLGKILDDQLIRERALAVQELSLAKLQAVATGTTIDNLQAIGDAEIKILEIEERITGQRSEQIVNTNSLLKEQYDAQLTILDLEQAALDSRKSRNEQVYGEEKTLLEKRLKMELTNMEISESQKEAIKEDFRQRREQLDYDEQQRLLELRLRDESAQIERDEIDIERRRMKGERVLELEVDLLEKKRDLELSNTELTELERSAIYERYALEEARIRQEANNAKAISEKAFTQSAIANAAELFGVSKEVALAQMIMAAPQAIGNSFAKAAEIYAPPLSIAMGAAGAAGVIAPIMQSIQDIRSSNVSSSSSSSSASASSSRTSSSITNIAANNAVRMGVDPSMSSSATRDASANIQASSSQNIVFSESKYNDFKQQVQFKEDKSTF